MKVKRLLIFIALMLSFSIAITDFMPNYARDTTGLIGASISQKLAGSLFENGLAVTLDPDPNTMITSESACPGLQVTYYLMVTNASGHEETVTFSPSGNSWTTLIDPSSITLLNGEMEYIAVAVQIPWTTNPGDQDVVTITALGQTSGLSDSVTLTTITAIAQGWEDF